MRKTLVQLILICMTGWICAAACNQKPNPHVDWPPMPGWEHADPHAGDAGGQ